MRKILCIILVCMMGIGLVGCGVSKTDKLYTVNSSKTSEGSLILNISLDEKFEISYLDNQDNIGIFLNEIMSEFKVKQSAGAMIKDCNGDEVAHVYFYEKDGVVEYIYSNNKDVMSGTIE